jgi:hypothetical protein
VPLRVRDGDRAVAGEGGPAGEQRVQQATDAVDVARRRGCAALDQLRRQVGRRPHHRARRGESRRGLVHGLGDAEVGQLEPAVPGQQHVVGLHVAVDQPLAVGVRQRLQHAEGQGDRLLQRERSLPGQPGTDGLAVHQLHDEVRLPGVLAGVVHRDHVRVPETGRRPRLAQEPLAGRGIGRHRQELHRDLAVEHPVVGRDDAGHAAGTELAAELVAVGDHLGHATSLVSWDRPA